MNKALLFRKQGPAWEFESTKDGPNDRLLHVTKYGTVYAIFTGLGHGKPLWIARLIDDKSGAYWFTDEARLKAQYIKFENGDEYWFGKYTYEREGE